jgi:hypothetical protein
MRHSALYPVLLCAAAGALLFTASCGSKGPEPPKPGTPPFIWGVARDAYKSGDYLGANENLDRLVRGKSEFVARAAPVKLLVGAGLAKAYMELADKFDVGGRANRSDPFIYRKQVIAFRTQAKTIAMQTAETAHQSLDGMKDAAITVAFPFPAGSTEEAASLKKLATGMQLQQSEVDKATREMLQRGVVLMFSRAAGFPKDVEKARAAFKPEDTPLARDPFLLAVAGALFEISDLFDAKKMDEPDKTKILCEQALEALAVLPQSKDKKDLTDKIQKALKKVRR